MPQENKLQLKHEDLKKILEGLAVIKAVLKPYLVTLTAVERQELPRMSDGIAPFVHRALEYAQTHTGFVPTYVNIKALKADLEVVDLLAQIFRPLEQLYFDVNDTMTLSGSEAYVASLAFYHSVKQAEKLNVPGSKAIAEDLGALLHGGRKTINEIKILKWIKAVSGRYRINRYLN